jgi:homoserine kinase
LRKWAVRPGVRHYFPKILISATTVAGAYGCTVSGAGPTAVAICEDAAVAEKVGQARGRMGQARGRVGAGCLAG